MFRMWIYFVMAAAIAGAAFLIGRIVPGLGVAFVAGATTLWTAYAVQRQRRLGNGRCDRRAE